MPKHFDDRPQIERARGLYRELTQLYPALVRIKDDLAVLTEESQNGPPRGDSDGTIDEPLWNRLRFLEKYSRDLCDAVMAFKQKDK